MKQIQSPETMLTIGQVSKLTGVGIETIRYYEKEGLLRKPARTVSGYRQYSSQVIAQIRFILRAKDLGFSLSEVSELLSLRMKASGRCKDVKEKASKKIADIEDKIDVLQRMKKALSQLVSACNGQGSVDECPVLQALDES